MRLPRNKPVTNPIDFPVEVVMLFERAAYNPIRVPEAGKGFETRNKALGSLLVFSRWKAAMYRSPEAPRAWKALLSTIQFSSPEKVEDGWCFYIKPLLNGNATAALARDIIGEPVSADTFWATYKEIQ